MRGLMMDFPLLISTLLKFAAQNHADTEIVSRTVEGPIHRYTYADANRRSKKLAKALGRLGVNMGDRIATLAWNGYRHFEIYFGVSGSGAICHTINPRLFPEQIAYIINHAEDAYIFSDLTFVPLLEGIAGQIPGVKGFVIMTDEANMPKTKLKNALCYERLLAAEDDGYEWPVFDENTASALCYTSGTTGNPKGTLYSHRATVLHSYAVALPDSLHLSAREVAMPVVPMFHVNAWEFPYAAPLAGAKLVFPGPKMDGESLQELIETEGVTVTAGVPTVWMLLLAYLKKSGKRIDSLKRAVIGGSALPGSMIQEFRKYGTAAIHAWGMTECSSIGTVNLPKRKMEGLPEEERLKIEIKQGRPPFGVEFKITGDDGGELPRDGVAFGNLKMRGPWVCSRYFNEEESDVHDADGWFQTGDVATIDPDGYMHLTDRTKDVIKSGGEWISSIELENIAFGHPDVKEAAVISADHPKWGERPLLLAVLNEGANLAKEDLLAFYEGKIAKWCIPNDAIFVEELPHTATGKLLKTKLREDFAGYTFPD
ncbi:MAG: 3-(methylthio)propionyl-CoA ligase [bacterium]|nr:3-(methylthio)propionyl-CoA ligase [bacterium]